MANLWFMIPKLTKVDRGNGEEQAISIGQGQGSSGNLTMLGVGGSGGGFTLQEAEDLMWRLKQGVQLLKHGKIRKQHA